MWNPIRSLRPQGSIRRLLLLAAAGFFLHATPAAHADEGNDLLAQAVRMLIQALQSSAAANQSGGATEADALPAVPAAPAPPPRRTGLQTGSLQTGSLQPSGGLTSGPGGPTPMAEWRQLFPK